MVYVVIMDIILMVQLVHKLITLYIQTVINSNLNVVIVLVVLYKMDVVMLILLI